MSVRAEELATRFEQANQTVIDMVSGSADLSVTCPVEGWTAAALGAHVGGGHFGIVEYLIKPIVASQELQPFDLASFNEGNAKAAAENATLPKDQVLVLLRDNGATAAAYLRSLSDDDLDRTTTLPVFGPEPVTAQQVIEMVLIGHPLDHGNSLRQGLGHAEHEHTLQGAPA
ncbi:MAG: maleylpyruvate isomerase N-terminal domain-containing protein [Thermomicrobiales bacterium]